MSKRWAGLPQGLRWLIVGIAAVLALAILWALLVPGADTLANHDVGSVTGPLRVLRLQTARDAARGRLLTLGAGVLAAGALIFTASNYRLARRTHELTEQGQVTDRYTRAIEQLGSDKLDVRIGSIYALERIVRDSARDHSTVMEVLSVFAREHSREQWAQRPADDQSDADRGGRKRTTHPDVQAAATVIARRNISQDSHPIDLTGVDLTGAWLDEANFVEAWFDEANLTDATIMNANFSVAFFTNANLTRARLGEADLNNANFTNANLSGADLSRADLSFAEFTGADLTGADLKWANLTGADFTGADLTRVGWPSDVAVPEGWKQDADSGRLKRADTDSGESASN
jgi:Pentapeptide repeats (8 copies)